MIDRQGLRVLMALYDRKTNEVAAAAGISEQRVRQVLSGEQKVRQETIERIELAIVLAGREVQSASGQRFTEVA